jgi:hypothetical protein
MLLVAAALAVAGAAIIGRWLPSRHADASPVDEPATGMAGIDRPASAG